MLHQNITLFPQGTGKRERVCWGFPGSSVVKNLPTMQETWVQSLDREDPLEEGMSIHSSVLAWRILMDREAWQATVHRFTKSRTQLKQAGEQFNLLRKIQ